MRFQYIHLWCAFVNIDPGIAELLLARMCLHKDRLSSFGSRTIAISQPRLALLNISSNMFCCVGAA